MGKIPVKLQKHRANWFAIGDVQKLMEDHSRLWDPDYYEDEAD
ncbi:MAG: hypothetical protein ACJ0BN_17680 [Limisphaerales bacterium]